MTEIDRWSNEEKSVCVRERESVNKREILKEGDYLCVSVCLCVCVCLQVGEKKREKHVNLVDSNIINFSPMSSTLLKQKLAY